jgi:hypothetical protein
MKKVRDFSCVKEIQTENPENHSKIPKTQAKKNRNIFVWISGIFIFLFLFLDFHFGLSFLMFILG